MKTETCMNCGEPATVRKQDFRFDEMGVPVVLKKIEVIACHHCGEVDPIIPNINALDKVLASAIMCSPCKLNGREIRFLRKYVNKSARDFAKYLDIGHTHLSKLENERYEVTPGTDRLIRLVVGAMDCGLTSQSKTVVELMPNIQDRREDDAQHINIDPSKMTYQYA